MRYYVIASPGSGKTYFFNKHKRKYGSLKIYDLDWLKWKNGKKVLDVLENVIDGSVVLGSLGEFREDYQYFAVIIPKKLIIKNIEKRQLKKRKRKIEQYWDNINNVLNDKEKGYNKTVEIVKLKEIETFQSLEECVYYIDLFSNKKNGA